MHTLVQIFYLTRKEFERNLEGLTDEDARKRIEPMNCISWIIAHVAMQQRAYFVDWAHDRDLSSRYEPYITGSPASQPSLEEAMSLWQDACKDSNAWLQAATDDNLKVICERGFSGHENYGNLLTRCILHHWCHLGEISAIRQILGHKPPEFVNPHGWSYGKAESVPF